MISFADFFGHVHGAPLSDEQGSGTSGPGVQPTRAGRPVPKPYPWQERFAARCAEGEPPSMICAPTGAGKTATVDALVWALAMQAERQAADRTVGVRTIWAIDRRILVDEVHEHAKHIAALLDRALGDSGDPLHEMAQRLSALSGDRPLVATRWRGGVHDPAELLAPTQPEIITSTIAQVGSRLLFRGYGVGRKSLALEAGLVGCDTTICLDEAHLAEPFAQTVAAVKNLRAESESELELPQLRTITLTATPSDPPADAIRLTEEDESALGLRYRGEKWASLDDTADSDAKRAARIAELAVAYLEEGKSSLACVTNTVKQARLVFDRLSKKIDEEDATLALLIGPQRPADRSGVLRKIKPLFEGADPERPIVCVATQTLEVGLDVDVAAMVTESASATALVQRLGRLNRKGSAPDGAPRAGHATIVRDEGSWLYKDDEAHAWDWLERSRGEDGRIDISVARLDQDEDRPDPEATSHAPALTPEIVDQLVQTNPLPGPFQDPDVEPFLRGVESETSVDVSVCWRCDLRPEATGDADAAYRKMLLELVPPQRQETLTLSIRSARALLATIYPEDINRRNAAVGSALSDPDIEGDAATGAPPAISKHLDELPYVVIRGEGIIEGSLQEEKDKVRPSDLQPGDVLVIPTAAGGVDEFGLTSDPKSRARDVAPDLCPLNGGAAEASNFGLRLSPQTLEAMLGYRPSRPLWLAVANRCRSVEAATIEKRPERIAALVKTLREWLPDFEVPAALHAALEERRVAIRSLGNTRLEELDATSDEGGEDADEGGEDDPESFEAPGEQPGDDYETWSLEGASWVIVPLSPKRQDERDRTGETAPPTIAAHAEAVRERARHYATKLGLSPPIIEVLELAARVHDHGKADPRIQAFFRRGVAPIGEEPLAKSVFGTRDPRTSRIAAERAGLPSGLHHEFASAAILADALARTPDLHGPGVDPHLALFLTSVHHGRANPFPVVPQGGGAAREFQCDAAGVSGTARGDGIENWMSGGPLDAFWKTIKRYGAWGASYLAAVLMLADRTVSSEGR